MPPEHENRHPGIAAAGKGHREWWDGGEIGGMGRLPECVPGEAMPSPVYQIPDSGNTVGTGPAPRFMASAFLLPGVQDKAATGRVFQSGKVLLFLYAGWGAKPVDIYQRYSGRNPGPVHGETLPPVNCEAMVNREEVLPPPVTLPR